MIPDTILLALGFAAIGSAAVLAGAVLSLLRELSPGARSAIQHLAAGTVFAGLTVDVLDKLVASARDDGDTVIFTAIGFAIGLVVMIGLIRGLAERVSGAGSLAPTIVVDLITDGGLIGLSTGLGSPTAAVLAGALAPEVFFLGVTLNEELRQGSGGESEPGRPQRRLLGVAGAIAVGILAAGALGWVVSRAGIDLRSAFYAFGGIALGYLVLEELLTEAHEQRRGPVLAGLLFVAFAVVFLAGLLVV